MGNTATIKSRRNSTSAGSNVKRVHWGGSGLPGPPGKPILIPSFTEDLQPIIVGIRWERSASNGGSPIMGYLVEHRRLGSPHWVKSSPGLCSFPELTLTGLEPGWRYQFRVRAQNSVGLSATSEISDPLTVTLQRAEAAAPYFISELSDTTALENEQVEFIVYFSGTPIPKISWFKDGFEIFSSRRTKIITENGKSSLVIHQTALNDEGEIKCVAANKAGHVSTRGKLILHAFPKIRLPRQYEDGLLFEKGETIRLKISIAGRPSPSVTWYHDGEIVNLDDKHLMESIDTGEYSLTIVTAVRKDRGEYTIKAANNLGEDSSSFLVTVTDRPAAPRNIKITMTLGRSVTLSWEEPEDDGGCKIGTYIVEYYRTGWNVWLKANTSRRPETTLVDLIGDSEYKFRVKAENPYGVSDPSRESEMIFISPTGESTSTPSLAEVQKYQEEHMNYRGRRMHKNSENLPTSTKRTRSLTRGETTQSHEFTSRSVSVQRLTSDAPSGPLTKSSRSDSRVTFADTVCLHVDKPLDDSGPRAKPRSKRDKNLKMKETFSEPAVPDSDIPPPPDTTSKSPLNFVETASTSEIFPIDSNNLAVATDFDLEKNDEEFMLILYPNADAEDLEKKYPPEGDYNFEYDDDLLPPPMSHSLPELFSIDHHIVPTLREAFSSTELLHERAIERFHKAIAMEEANDTKKESSLLGNSNKLRSILSHRATAGSSTHAGLQAAWNKRRLSEGQASANADRTSVLVSEPLVITSDPNLVEANLSEASQNVQPSPEFSSLRRWNDESLFSATDAEPAKFELDYFGQKFSADTKESSYGEADLDDVEDEESETSGDFNITSEGNAYSAKMVIHDKSIRITQPKSILKKRTEEVPAPFNGFGTRIPVERAIKPATSREFSADPILDKVQPEVEATESDKLLAQNFEPKIQSTSDTESDNSSLLIAAEVAQNRRKLSAKSLLTRRSSSECKEDVEAQRAVIDHYTEIVNAHARNSSLSPSRQIPSYSVPRSSRPTSPIQMSTSVMDRKSEDLASMSPPTQNVDAIQRQRKPYERQSTPISMNSTAASGPSYRPSRMDQERASRESSTSRSSSKTRKKRGPSLPKTKMERKRSDDVSTPPIRNESSGRVSRQTDGKQKIQESERRLDAADAVEDPLMAQAQVKVQSIMSYSIDLILLLGAVYIYIFKKEILAIPLIGLVLYRRIQTDLTKWIVH